MQGLIVPVDGTPYLATMKEFEKTIGEAAEGLAIVNPIKCANMYAMFVADTGRLRGLDVNERASKVYGMAIYGDALIVAEDEDGLIDLNLDEWNDFLELDFSKRRTNWF